MQAKAWLLDIGTGFMTAVGAREVIHLLDVPVAYPVPHTPPYCSSVVSWQGQLLPVMNMAARLGGELREARFMAVVGYQLQQGGEVSYGAMPLVSPPRQILVADEQACNLPDAMTDMQSLAISCFMHEDQPVPVLNLQQVFARPPLPE